MGARPKSELVELGKTLLTHILSATSAKPDMDVEKAAREIADALVKYYGLEEFIKLVQNADKNKTYISYVHERLPHLWKYYVTMLYGDDIIRFLITEERKDDEWVVTDITVVSILTPIST
jgi:hypothetical protein